MPAAAQPLPALIARTITRLAIVNGLMLWGLLWAADTAAWPEAWWCMGFLFAGLTASSLYVARVNPDLVAARLRFGAGTRGWDYLMLAILVLGTTALLHVAGFGWRLGWPRFPLWLEAPGNVLMLAGIAGVAWAQGVNRHFESSVRIQSERGHAVIDTGPYAIVRHPGYAAGALILVGMALALGAPYALVPAGLVIATIAVRTVLEERTLIAGLPGYADYSRRIRHRWIPGLW